MKGFMTYARNHKGITLVLMAIMLAVLIIFAALAIDIAYMYFEKNQLQVAADAAALAGVAKIDCDDLGATCNNLLVYDTAISNFSRMQARKEAWKIACKNKTTNRAVFLVTDDGRDPSSPNCDTPPTSDLNESSNTISGDIVVGNWNPTPTLCPSTGLTDNFCPANGSTGRVINALQASPGRTGVTPGMPAVTLFIGKIFQFFGADWSFMSARASAIAAMQPRASSFVSVGSTFCSANCPGGATYPTICELSPPISLTASPTSGDDNLKFGWTSLLLRPGNSNDFSNLMCTDSPYQDICASGGIWGISGTSNSTLQDYESIMFDPTYDSSNKETDASGNVTGWWTLLPQVAETDPMSGPDPDAVIGYVLVRIIAVCATGTTGCRGYGSPHGLCGSHGTYPNHSIVVDRISCISCDSAEFGLRYFLVR